jgi:predicted MFS family arabinose efflux permease
VICAVATGPLVLAAGRVVTGLGISAGLIAMIKVNTQWYPKERVAQMTGLGVFVGALGSLSATVPAAVLVPLLGWRGVFLLLGAMACAPRSGSGSPCRTAGRAAPPRRRLAQEVAEFGRIFVHPAFLRFAPAVALLSALNFTYRASGPGPGCATWAGWGRRRARGAALLRARPDGGSAGSGAASSFLQRRGAHADDVPWAAFGVVALVQLLLVWHPMSHPAALGAVWFVFALCGAAGPSGYTAIGQRFGPELAGRVATAINFAMLLLVFLLQNAIGWILDLWPARAGRLGPGGLWLGARLTLALQAATLLPILRRARRG